MVDPGFIAKTTSPLDNTSNMIKLHLHDVVSGRGKAATKHLGNKYLRKLTFNYKKEYKTTRNYDRKRKISSLILKQIKGLDPPGRFLKLEMKRNYWIELSHHEMITKISQALREEQKESHSEIVVNHKKIFVLPSSETALPYFDTNNDIPRCKSQANAEKHGFLISGVKSEAAIYNGVKETNQLFSANIISSDSTNSFLAYLKQKPCLHKQVKDYMEIAHIPLIYQSEIEETRVREIRASKSGGSLEEDVREKRYHHDVAKSCLQCKDNLLTSTLVRSGLPLKKRKIF